MDGHRSGFDRSGHGGLREFERRFRGAVVALDRRREQTDTSAADIPLGTFEGEADRINEDTAGTNVGETGDMQPGTTKTLTIDLAPGHYVFLCNLPGHYQSGMHVDVTVP
jgi:uncharacterized cupredoxin-like copper-binding protein